MKVEIIKADGGRIEFDNAEQVLGRDGDLYIMYRDEYGWLQAPKFPDVLAKPASRTSPILAPT